MHLLIITTVMAQSLSKLYVHIVTRTKYNSPLILKENKQRIYGYIGAIIKDNDSYPIKINGTADHIHILSTMSKNISLSDLNKEIKRNSSRWVKSLGRHYDNFSWQGGYGGFSVSPSRLEETIRYIEDQEIKHANMSFREEYMLLLKEYDIDYDPRYVFSE